MSEFLFGLATFLTLGGGIGMVATRNVVHAALFLSGFAGCRSGHLSAGVRRVPCV